MSGKYAVFVRTTLQDYGSIIFVAIKVISGMSVSDLEDALVDISFEVAVLRSRELGCWLLGLL